MFSFIVLFYNDNECDNISVSPLISGEQNDKTSTKLDIDFISYVLQIHIIFVVISNNEIRSNMSPFNVKFCE
jgi:hypothetical protein